MTRHYIGHYLHEIPANPYLWFNSWTEVALHAGGWIEENMSEAKVYCTV